MTKILGVKEFMVNEGYAKLHRMVEDVLNLTSLKARCMWDGERWHDYDHERRGTIEDFKALPENNNTHLEVYINYEFKINEKSFKIEELVDVHFSNMADNNYDVELKYCHGIKEFIDYMQTYQSDDDEFEINLRELIETDFNDIEDTLANDIEDYTGINDSSFLDEIYFEAIDGFMDNFE